MPEASRAARVGALIKQEISTLLVRGGIKDPRVKMATIADVQLTKDLKIAKVYVQVIGSGKEREQAVIGMTSAAGWIRKELKNRLSLRSVPELRFFADETGEKADKVLGLLAEIDRKRQTADSSEEE
jgi:ribosome-binding factor A